MLEYVSNLGIFQQCFRWDATNIETHTAERFLLDNGHFQSELGRPNRCDIASGSSS